MMHSLTLSPASRTILRLRRHVPREDMVWQPVRLPRNEFHHCLHTLGVARVRCPDCVAIVLYEPFPHVCRSPEPTPRVPHSFFCSGLFPMRATLNGPFSDHSEAVASNLLGISCFVILARWMYLRKIFINV
jgi:hypothetical protein